MTRSATAPDSGPGQLRVGWWVPALAQHERGDSSEPGAGVPPPGDTLVEPGGGHGPPSPPPWAGFVEQAIATAAPPDIPPPLEDWQEAFAVPFWPFLRLARDRLVEGARSCLLPAHADPGPIGEAFTAALGPRLARLAARTMVRELEEAGADDRPAVADGRQRLAGFIRRLCQPAGLAALFEEYPVLARLLGTASEQAAEAGLELLRRFAADRAAVVGTLLGGVDPGPVVAIEPGLGDRHQRGRSVAAVAFADGRKVIYKPRDLTAHALFSDVIDWLNERVPHSRLRTAGALVRAGYGWLEFVGHRPLSRPGAAEEFYRREGVLLAALYALRASDIHGENLIARGEDPVLVDVETLFQPTLSCPRTTGDDPAALAQAASVDSAALLPCLVAGEDGVHDLSGMGDGQGGAVNRPRFGAEPTEPADHETAVLDGFRLGYDAIAADRLGFSRLIESHGDIEIRIVARHSSGYARLLAESTHPDLLRDARDREQALAALHQVSAGQPPWNLLARHELIDLWAGDIPLLTGHTGTRDIWTSAGQRLPGVLDQPPLAYALDTVAGLGDVDRRDQEWFISACLATRRPDGGHHSTAPLPGRMTATAASPGRLLAAACGVADQIVARGMTSDDGSRVNWLGLQPVDDTLWMVLPMGAGLAHGYLGVALFLAQLASLTGIGRYAEVARRAVSAMPRLLDGLADRPELLLAVGCGAAESLGGISYGLARLATLLDDEEARDWAATAVRLAVHATDLPGTPWWAEGWAGCLAAMTATAAELDPVAPRASEAATALARECSDRLAGLVESTDGRCVTAGEQVPSGFATGPAGVGYALVRFAAATAEPAYFRAGRRAVHRAAELTLAATDHSPGWCRGTAGLLVARACVAAADDLDDHAPEKGRARLGRQIGWLAATPVLRDLSLCHGELGIADALTLLTSAGQDGVGAGVWRQRVGLVLSAINQHTRFCGTPGGVSTPGLMRGLAGVGYGLLRLGFSDRVPSVLFLEAAPDRSPARHIDVAGRRGGRQRAQ
ncbi:MAG TPA: type 2 lanthipeptide synthetase LanM family protein [Streptosporangiaceae bacterium]|nr:type 2 lanthipeptide synthetase LanM family protein [Streptosporangiaceae bacterium]